MTTDLADIIDSKTQEIRAEDGQVYTKMEDLADELPESSPRFILLSYPLTLVGGIHAAAWRLEGSPLTFVKECHVLVRLTFSRLTRVPVA